MKRLLAFACLGGMAVHAIAFVPFFFGARSLSLGQGTLAFNYDANAVYLNPALLSRFNYTASGLQYQHHYFDFKDFGHNLSALLGYDLHGFESLASGEKEKAWGDLQDLFHSKVGISGFQLKNTGFGTTDYGLAVSAVDEAVISPWEDPILNFSAGQVTNSDIADLKMDFLGWHYTQYSLSYSLSLSQSLNIGATVHYLKGQVSDFQIGLLDPIFSKDNSSRDYLAEAWNRRETGFSRITLDLGASATFGRLFYAGLVVKNLSNPEIKTSRRSVNLQRRVIAGIAFQSQDLWGIFLDIDVNKVDLFYNGKKSQPISFGVEKGFFQNVLSLRAGILHDLSEEELFGSRTNILYGLGLGFNLSKFQIDLALGINSTGKVKSLAISGFFLVRGKN